LGYAPIKKDKSLLPTLVELVTGTKAMDLTRPKGKQCHTEWESQEYENIILICEITKC